MTHVVSMLIAHVVVVLVAHVLGVLVAHVVAVLVLAHVVGMLIAIHVVVSDHCSAHLTSGPDTLPLTFCVYCISLVSVHVSHVLLPCGYVYVTM